jgi:choline-sulfatase
MLVRAPGRNLRKVVATQASLIDVAPTLLEWMGVDVPNVWPGQSLIRMAEQADDPTRPAFSEYHAAGAKTGAFMLRKEQWKLIYYVDMQPQLFDIAADPEELVDLVPAGKHQNVLQDLTQELRAIVDMEAQDLQAKADQHALVKLHGGRAAVIERGGFGATPAPGVKPLFA